MVPIRSVSSCRSPVDVADAYFLATRLSSFTAFTAFLTNCRIGSDTVLSGVPGLLHYVSSKGAVVAFTRSLASELGDDGIRVNAIAPGFTPTPAALELGGDAVTRSIERRALKRSQTPEDLVGTVSWLLSADSAFVTGQLITVNGGYIYH